MSESLKISYAAHVDSLSATLAQVERPESFCTSGIITAAPPLLTVDDVGVVSIPVPGDQARTLAASASKAPYGKGDQTIVDESVRKVRQIVPERIHLGGKGWKGSMDVILSRVTAGLGCPEGSLGAHLYKLLVYETGGFFLSHRDTEKEPGMLGTLIVVLPSDHSGGELVVRHDGREEVLDLRTSDPGELHYAAFYADCEHEVRPITDGHRVCLVYNLIMVGHSGAVPGAPDLQPQIEASAAALRAWESHSDRSHKLVYLLEHRYTENAISFALLKGPDAVRAQVLREAAAKVDFAFHLAMVHIEETGWAEYSGGYGYSSRRRRGRYWDEDTDEVDVNPKNFEIGEVCDWRRYVAQWRDTEDRHVEFGEIPLEEDEIFPVGALDSEEADKTHFSEATGNEGASFERTYLRAALVLWPIGDLDLVCATAGVPATLALLESRVEESLADPTNDAARRGVGQLAEKLCAQLTGHPVDDPDGTLARTIDVLVRFGDAELLHQEVLPVMGVLPPTAMPPLVAWAVLAGSSAFAPIGNFLLSPESRTGSIPSIELWTGCAEGWIHDPAAGELLYGWLDLLYEKLAAKRISPSDARARLMNFFPIYQSDQPPAACSPALLAAFLRMVETWFGEAATRSALSQVTAHRETFPTSETILPALESSAHERDGLPATAIEFLWQDAVTFLLEGAAKPPSSPSDWSQTLTAAQRTALPANLREFALDPQRNVLRLRLRKELRQQIHQTIVRLGLDMTHVTERTGSPHTLVCTKTHGRYDRECAQYQKDYSSLQRLAALPGHKTPGELTAALVAGKNWKPEPPAFSD